MVFYQKLAFDFKEHHRENGEDLMKDAWKMVAEAKEKVQEFLRRYSDLIDRIGDRITVIKSLLYFEINNTKLSVIFPNLKRVIEKAVLLIQSKFTRNGKYLSNLIEQYLVLTIVLAGTVNDFCHIEGSVATGEDPQRYWNRVLTVLEIIKNEVPSKIDDPKFYKKLYKILVELLPTRSSMLLSLIATVTKHFYGDQATDLLISISQVQIIVAHGILRATMIGAQLMGVPVWPIQFAYCCFLYWVWGQEDDM